MLKVIHIAKKKDDHADVDFWRACSYEERLKNLEELRRAYHQWVGYDQSRLQRVYCITQRK